MLAAGVIAAAAVRPQRSPPLGGGMTGHNGHVEVHNNGPQRSPPLGGGMIGIGVRMGGIHQAATEPAPGGRDDLSKGQWVTMPHAPQRSPPLGGGMTGHSRWACSMRKSSRNGARPWGAG